MKYKISEIFTSIQGEGINTGCPALFIRFAECNLGCVFCDTTKKDEFKEYELKDIYESALEAKQRLVILTGGEPMLQLDYELLVMLRGLGYKVAVETNGTIKAVYDTVLIDHLTVSPKPDSVLVQTSGTEIKVLYPLKGIKPADYERMDFKYFYIQPVWGQKGSLQACIKFCLANPFWRLSCQVHKYIGVE